jgi:hypothetical protein
MKREMSNAYKTLIGKSEVKRLLESVNTEMDIRC